MPVYSSSKLYYSCICDKCGKFEVVEESKTIYNRAQAVRSLGWSYGKDKSVLCANCRKMNYGENYAKRKRW